jgi:hypothetical protein
MNIRQVPQSARRHALAAAMIASIALIPGATAHGQDPQPQSPPAGDRPDPRQIIDMRMARMTETLKLDSAQQDKIRWIVSGETVDLEVARKNGSGRSGGGGGRGGGGGGRHGGGGGGGGGRRSGGPPDSTGSRGSRGSPEMHAIWDRANKQIEAVLNPQQLTTFRQIFEQQPAT